MALPGIYRPSLRIRRNKTKREGPSPDSQRESHKKHTAKGKQQEPKRGKTERGGTVTKVCPTANEFLEAKAKTNIVG